MAVITIKEISQKYSVTQDTLRYYERAGMIPPVQRTAGGIRSYQESDLRWVELALCMRSAGLSVEAIAKYVKLTQEGDATIADRHTLLCSQREILLEQQKQIEETLKRLNYKIEVYENALETGALNWNQET